MQAEIKRNAMPLASPLPTAAPRPRDVTRKLLEARQGLFGTCGWISGESSAPITCPSGYVCAQNALLDAVFCCDALYYPYCGVVPTSCLDSTEVRASCTGTCLFDDSTVKCTLPGSQYCVFQNYPISSLATTLTRYACASEYSSYDVYEKYTLDNGDITYVTGIISAASTGTASTPVTGTSRRTSSEGPLSPVTSRPATPTPAPNPSGLSAGVIAGIVIGALGFIAIILCLAFALFWIAKRRRRQTPPAPATMVQTPANPPPNPPTNPHSSMLSYPSATSSTPLTHANMAAVSQPSEVSPNDSASQMGGQASTFSYTSPPTYHSDNSANHAMEGTSTVGPLPQHPDGSAAFPHNTTPSVMSPGSAFGSMPPIHAPSVTSHRPEG